MNYETLNQVQGDRLVVTTWSLDGAGDKFFGDSREFQT
jgi:hypothetical protein